MHTLVEEANPDVTSSSDFVVYFFLGGLVFYQMVFDRLVDKVAAGSIYYCSLLLPL